MGTRSRIGVLNEDGSVTSIYCHWDGYPSNAGDILLTSYKDPTKIQELLDLGNLSSLGHSIGVAHKHGEGLSNACTAYMRDRGEKDQESASHENVKRFSEYGEEYNYLFENGKWSVQSNHWEQSDKFHEVTETLNTNDGPDGEDEGY